MSGRRNSASPGASSRPARRVTRSPRQSVVRDRRGFALEATLMVMVLVAVLVGLSLTWIVTTTRTAGVDYRGSRVTYAAEAGADAIMAQLEVAMEDGVLSDAEIDALALPELDGFIFEDMTVTSPGGVEARAITSGNFAGLFSLNQPVELAITARDDARNKSTVVVTVNAQSIPLFQFGVFYEEDLEIHNGPPMEFAGWVHTNSNLYLSSNATYFQSRITTPDSMFWRRKDTIERLTGVHVANEGGTAVRLDFDSRAPADPAAFRAESQDHFDSRLMTEAHGVTPLRLPLPDGMPPIELIRRRIAGDIEQTKKVKFAWKADWYIDLDLSDPSELDDADVVCDRIIAGSTRTGSLVKPTRSQCKTFFVFTENAFEEGRERTRPDVLDLNVAKLREWVENSRTSRETRILYITFSGQSSDSRTTYPVVRLHNGSELPNPITIATEFPLYVKGNYNTSGWQPAALLGDAITFLSSAWSDPYQNTFVRRSATSTGMRVFAAIAAGHSATPCDAFRGCGSPPPYGGGLENFPRFLEDWGGKYMTYRGSLVSLFQSQKANRGLWQNRAYYTAPNRDWEFDLRFQDPDNLPPGTPAVGNVFQTAFRPVY